MSTVAKIRETEPEAPAAGGAPHVLVAINAVMDELSREGIAKDRNNAQQNYRFRGIDDVYNALAPILARHKLVIKPRGLGRTCEERQSSTGKPIFYVNVAMEFDLISAVDGSRETAGPFYGEAQDMADKATNKAQSAAYKYMAMQQFCIPTEGDNDADATTHEVAARPKAVDMAITLLRGCGDGGLFKEAWAKNIDGWKKVLSPEDLGRLGQVKKELVAKFVREAAEAMAREEAAKPKGGGGESFASDDPFDDEIPFIRKWGVL